MARDRLEKDRDYVCCEQVTGSAVRGSLRVTDYSIEVRLVSFDDFFFINDDTEYLPLRLEDNSYASMHYALWNGPPLSAALDMMPVFEKGKERTNVDCDPWS